MSQKFVCVTCCNSGSVPAGRTADHRMLRIKFAIERFDFVSLARAIEPNVKRRKNPAFDRQQVSGKNKIFSRQAEMIGNFRRVAMREKVVRAEILIHLDKLRFALRFFARAAHARLAIANDSARSSRSSPLRRAAASPESQKWDSIPDFRRGAPSAARPRKAPADRIPPRARISVSGAGSLYHVANVSGSRKRNAPLKSTMRSAGFAASSAGTNSIEASCGVERNTTSAPLVATASAESGLQGASPQPRSCGNSSVRQRTFAWLSRKKKVGFSICGCRSRSRASSNPA